MNKNFLPCLLLLGLFCSCAPPDFTEMINVPPVEGYEERLGEIRAQRDSYFATDPASPLLPEEREGFGGLEYYEPDPSLYFVGDLQIYREPETLQMVTTAGKVREAQRVGFVAFRVGGQPHRLQVYRLLDGSGGLFLPFQDGTTGQETYAAGRYVNLVASSDSGPYEMDFNMSYNPSCAYGGADRFACPITPEENRLSIEIAAGERGRQHAEVEGG